MQTPRVPMSEIVRRGMAARRLARNAAAVTPARPLDEFTGFGSDPGNLRALCYLPEGLPRDGTAALVVALHGCTQTAAAYDRGCGWSVLAEREGFALLLPEQQRANNQNLCFNWFETGDTTRDKGEVASVRQMIAAVVERHRLDPRRVFVTGLSAGGATTAAMLATYPEVFAGGAILAGLPYGAASSVTEAFETMRGNTSRSARSWGDAVRGASPLRPGAKRPPVSIWHGEADATVLVGNAVSLTAQWADVLGLSEVPDETRTEGRHARAIWRDQDGRIALERHIIAGMGHGVPLHPGDAVGQCGVAGPFLLDVGLSSTLLIAEGWGLIGAGLEQVEEAPAHLREADARPLRAARPTDWVEPGHVVVVDSAGEARTADGPFRERPAPGPDRQPTHGAAGIVQDALELAANAHRMTPGEIVRDALAMAGLVTRR